MSTASTTQAGREDEQRRLLLLAAVGVLVMALVTTLTWGAPTPQDVATSPEQRSGEIADALVDLGTAAGEAVALGLRTLDGAGVGDDVVLGVARPGSGAGLRLDPTAVERFRGADGGLPALGGDDPGDGAGGVTDVLLATVDEVVAAVLAAGGDLEDARRQLTALAEQAAVGFTETGVRLVALDADGATGAVADAATHLAATAGDLAAVVAADAATPATIGDAATSVRTAVDGLLDAITDLLATVDAVGDLTVPAASSSPAAEALRSTAQLRLDAATTAAVRAAVATAASATELADRSLAASAAAAELGLTMAREPAAATGAVARLTTDAAAAATAATARAEATDAAVLDAARALAELSALPATLVADVCAMVGCATPAPAPGTPTAAGARPDPRPGDSTATTLEALVAAADLDGDGDVDQGDRTAAGGGAPGLVLTTLGDTLDVDGDGDVDTDDAAALAADTPVDALGAVLAGRLAALHAGLDAGRTALGAQAAAGADLGPGAQALLAAADAFDGSLGDALDAATDAALDAARDAGTGCPPAATLTGPSDAALTAPTGATLVERAAACVAAGEPGAGAVTDALVGVVDALTPWCAGAAGCAEALAQAVATRREDGAAVLERTVAALLELLDADGVDGLTRGEVRAFRDERLVAAWDAMLEALAVIDGEDGLDATGVVRSLREQVGTGDGLAALTATFAGVAQQVAAVFDLDGTGGVTPVDGEAFAAAVTGDTGALAAMVRDREAAAEQARQRDEAGGADTTDAGAAAIGAVTTHLATLAPVARTLDTVLADLRVGTPDATTATDPTPLLDDDPLAPVTDPVPQGWQDTLPDPTSGLQDVTDPVTGPVTDEVDDGTDDLLDTLDDLATDPTAVLPTEDPPTGGLLP